MTSARQIESNQRNARLSTGPITPEGKAKSRANALKHGLAAETLVIDGLQNDFAERKTEWAQSIEPSTPEGRFALEAVVACTFRLEECRRGINALIEHDVTRACLAWDVDREADVALVASRLAKQPELVARQLQASKQGIELMLRTWDRLGESLDTKKGAWNDAEISTAFDLLGVPGHLRDGRAPFDPRGEGEDVYQYRRTFIFSEYERLQTQLKELARVDRVERDHGERGASVLKSKPAALLLRYEREAWRRYDTMLLAARASGPQALPVPEVKLEQAVVVDSDAQVEADVQAMEDVEAEMVRRDFEVPNEPDSKPVQSEKLNRHQRRKQAAKARKV
jgi:hypothetical protein